MCTHYVCVADARRHTTTIAISRAWIKRKEDKQHANHCLPLCVCGDERYRDRRKSVARHAKFIRHSVSQSQCTPGEKLLLCLQTRKNYAKCSRVKELCRTRKKILLCNDCTIWVACLVGGRCECEVYIRLDNFIMHFSCIVYIFVNLFFMK